MFLFMKKIVGLCGNLLGTNEIDNKAAIRASSTGVLEMGFSIGRQQAIWDLWLGNEV